MTSDIPAAARALVEAALAARDLMDGPVPRRLVRLREAIDAYRAIDPDGSEPARAAVARLRRQRHRGPAPGARGVNEHRWLDPELEVKPPRSMRGSGIDDWHCACGCWGNFWWEGYARHLETVLAEAAAAERERLRAKWMELRPDEGWPPGWAQMTEVVLALLADPEPAP